MAVGEDQASVVFNSRISQEGGSEVLVNKYYKRELELDTEQSVKYEVHLLEVEEGWASLRPKAVRRLIVTPSKKTSTL